MFRSLIIIAALALIYLLIKRLFGKKTIEPSPNTVQCLVCNTFIPKHEAIIDKEHFFCSEQHLHDWQSKH